MTRKTTIQKDAQCDNCYNELPAETECLTDDETGLVFCDIMCINEYFSLEEDAGEDVE